MEFGKPLRVVAEAGVREGAGAPEADREDQGFAFDLAETGSSWATAAPNMETIAP